jgi:hypothetical protein
VSKSVNQLSLRLDSMEMTMRTTSDKNYSALHGISDTLDHLRDSMEHRCAPPETHKNADENGDAANRVPLSNPTQNVGTAANKDLLRRLKRGYLVQFDHDEPGEHQSAPARKARLLDILKREVLLLPIFTGSHGYP